MRFKVKKAGRSAPAVGYNTPRKRQQRRQTWNVLGEVPAIYDCSPADTEVAIMPSLEGDEIDVARAQGFREDRMHVMDWNPAIVATLKRRYPLIRTYGVDVARAFERMAAQGIKIGCANLDFCGNLARPVAEQVTRVVNSGALGGIAVVGVTVLRGREAAGVFGRLTADAPSLPLNSIGNSPWFHEIAALDPLDLSRIRAVQRLLSGETLEEIVAGPLTFQRYLTHARWSSVSRAGVYRSEAGTQTMLWMVIATHEAPCLCQTCFEFAALPIARAVRASGETRKLPATMVLDAIVKARGIPLVPQPDGSQTMALILPTFPAPHRRGRWIEDVQQNLGNFGVAMKEEA